tara:strand:- start:410 stop:1075 length:666 start_codon:yes stop_codon:yes gene_type:complete
MKDTVIDLDFDEMDLESGVFAISVVNTPAMKSNFLTLHSEVAEATNLSAVDDKKMLLMGAVMIPDLVIPRKNKTLIRFSADVIRKASQVFFKRGFQQKSTLEHNQEEGLKGMSVVESWIVEDTKMDKSAKYGLNLPVGTWCACVKADNEEIYELAKQGQINGFSIEGIFPDKTEVTLSQELDTMDESELEILLSMCELAEQLADTKEEARDFIKELISKTI